MKQWDVANIKIDSQNRRCIRHFQKLGAVVDYEGSEVELHIILQKVD